MHCINQNEMGEINIQLIKKNRQGLFFFIVQRKAINESI